MDLDDDDTPDVEEYEFGDPYFFVDPIFKLDDDCDRDRDELDDDLLPDFVLLIVNFIPSELGLMMYDPDCPSPPLLPPTLLLLPLAAVAVLRPNLDCFSIAFRIKSPSGPWADFSLSITALRLFFAFPEAPAVDPLRNRLAARPLMPSCDNSSWEFTFKSIDFSLTDDDDDCFVFGLPELFFSRSRSLSRLLLPDDDPPINDDVPPFCEFFSPFGDPITVADFNVDMHVGLPLPLDEDGDCDECEYGLRLSPFGLPDCFGLPRPLELLKIEFGFGEVAYLGDADDAGLLLPPLDEDWLFLTFSEYSSIRRFLMRALSCSSDKDDEDEDFFRLRLLLLLLWLLLLPTPTKSIGVIVTDAVDFAGCCCGLTAAATTLGDKGIISMASRLSVVMPMSLRTDLMFAAAAAASEEEEEHVFLKDAAEADDEVFVFVVVMVVLVMDDDDDDCEEETAATTELFAVDGSW